MRARDIPWMYEGHQSEILFLTYSPESHNEPVTRFQGFLAMRPVSDRTCSMSGKPGRCFLPEFSERKRYVRKESDTMHEMRENKTSNTPRTAARARHAPVTRPGPNAPRGCGLVAPGRIVFAEPDR